MGYLTRKLSFGCLPTQHGKAETQNPNCNKLALPSTT